MGSINVSSVRIGATDFEISYQPELTSDEGERLLGQIDYTELTIQLDPMAAPQKRDIVLIHEVIHGMFAHMGIEAHDEGLVTGLAEHLYGFLKDNPDFVKAFTEE